METYSDEENRKWAQSNGTGSHANNIVRLETALTWIELARDVNQHGEQAEVERCILKAEELIRRTLSGPPLTTLTPEEAVRVSNVTIGETFHAGHFENVKAAQRLRG